MFRKVLIANRAEIAARVTRTLRRMGIGSVAVCSEADRYTRPVLDADEHVVLGPAPARESYLRIERIVEACRQTGAEAVHPGYGFLSENARFVEALHEAGIAFIGPRAEHLSAFGLKHTARELALRSGVPLLPGSGLLGNVEQALAEAARIGFPLMLKSTAGGGGIGMQLCHDAADLAERFAAVQRLAGASFGDARVYLERFVATARHVEVQIFGDGKGTVLALGERDCSLQRRNQKVVEETPAPGLGEPVRRTLRDAAIRLGEAVQYESAGTVEFIYDVERGQVSFLEVNTRLQVEHPVTEAITGLDLVEWQLRVASGEPLPLQQDQIRMHGHAIEARICAENPDNNFLPATGTLQVYRKPQAVSFERGDVRFDDGVREGDTISPFYDSMVAKLIVHGDTREQALARLDAALAQTRIVGLNTNVQFLRHVVRSHAFATAKLDTALIQRESAVLFKQDPVGVQAAAAAVVAHTLAAEQALTGTDPFSRRDGWQSHGITRRRFELDYAGKNLQAELTYDRSGLTLQVAEDAAAPLSFTVQGDGLWVQHAERLHSTVHWQGEVAHVFTPRGATRISLLDPLAHAGEAAAEGGRLTAPMPGKVVSFAVKAGDKVKAGQPLAVMEAMKMEHTIAAPHDGTVAELLYAPGDQVTEGAELLKLQA